MSAHEPVPKDWMRLEILIAAFRDEYGEWPTQVGLGTRARDEIRSYLGATSYDDFSRKLAPLGDAAVIADQEIVIVGDDRGNRMSYDDVGWSGLRVEGVDFLEGSARQERTV